MSVTSRIYLGDWHSHPEDRLTPSPVDRRDWSGTLERAVYEQDFLLFAIVGRKSLCLWEGRPAGRRNTPLLMSRYLKSGSCSPTRSTMR